MTMATKRQKTRRPSHPGAVLRDCLPDTGLSKSEFAAALGVSPERLGWLLTERARMTADMAHRLARAFGTSAEVWMRLQDAVDLWEAEQAGAAAYARIERVTPEPLKVPGL